MVIPFHSQPRPCRNLAESRLTANAQGFTLLGAASTLAAYFGVFGFASFVTMQSTEDHLWELEDPSGPELLRTLNSILDGGHQIRYLAIKGHASKDLIQFNRGDGIIMASGDLGQIILGESATSTHVQIENTLRRILAMDAVINLYGCQTGRDEDNIARQMSLMLPGRRVSGGAGLYLLGVPGLNYGLGKKNYYVNGTLQ